MTTVLAYLDPGSGSMILQIIAGGLAAVAVTAKLYWNRVLRFLRIRKDEPEAAKPDTARSTDAAELVFRLGGRGSRPASSHVHARNAHHVSARRPRARVVS